MRHLSCLLPFLAAATLAACQANVDEPTKPGEPVEEQPQAACVAPVGTVEHTGDVVGDEVWKADRVHVVRDHLNVRNGARLTIEPCAVVRLEKDASVNVAYPLTPNTGELVAVGTEKQPIRFEGLDGARWGRLHVVTPGKITLAYTTLEGGGSAEVGGETLRGRGDQVLPVKPVVSLDHVTIKGSAGPGVRLDSGAGFGPSSELVITGSTSHPVEISEYALDSLPTGTYTGNQRDIVLVEPGGIEGMGGLQIDATIHDRGVPYVIGTSPGIDQFSIGWGDLDYKQPTVTFEAGVKMMFLKGSGFRVTGMETGAATIRALGTAEKPVVFSSAEPQPAAGDWKGFYFNGPVSPDNVMDHVRIEYTGADCGCILVSCNANVSEYEGAIIFSRAPSSAFLKNSVIAHGSGHGVVQGYDGASLDWRSGNSFEQVAGCRQTLPRDAETHCPKPMPACE